jgi:hypothetical protein
MNLNDMEYIASRTGTTLTRDGASNRYFLWYDKDYVLSYNAYYGDIQLSTHIRDFHFVDFYVATHEKIEYIIDTINYLVADYKKRKLEAKKHLIDIDFV